MPSYYMQLSEAARSYIDRNWPESNVQIDEYGGIKIFHARGFFSGHVDDIKNFAAHEDEDFANARQANV